MEHLKLEVNVPKESYELGKGVLDFLKEVRKTSGDPLERLPAIIAAALKYLLPAVDGYEKVVGEATTEPFGVAKALAILLADAEL